MSPLIDQSSEPSMSDGVWEIAEELQVVVNLLVRRLRRDLAQQGVTLSQVRALEQLEREGSHTVTDLARAVGVRAQSMTATVNAAEAAGFVERNPTVADRRQLLVTLTDPGRKFLQERRHFGNNRLAQLLAECLGPAELQVVKEAAAIIVRISR
ncbi:MarR family winged helix-turn-helix transcriptional regulator [Streptomyces kronopolitis]|uniref:MarR family winged helix-turn-helix transcriptional regulator n=1 Tax=Streptomyces kronopolitis TaxID=1612435 RepID=UPI0036B75FBC